MEKHPKLRKSEKILLLCAGVFLCGLLWLDGQERQPVADSVVLTELEAPQESFVPDVSPVNLNTADQAELETLPGIGPALAGRILEYRQAHGPFGTVEELLEVSGIGEEKLAGLREDVIVNGEK